MTGRRLERSPAREWQRKLADMRNEVELEIARTPSGMRRNHLTIVNTQLMVVEDAVRGVLHHDGKQVPIHPSPPNARPLGASRHLGPLVREAIDKLKAHVPPYTYSVCDRMFDPVLDKMVELDLLTPEERKTAFVEYQGALEHDLVAVCYGPSANNWMNVYPDGRVVEYQGG